MLHKLRVHVRSAAVAAGLVALVAVAPAVADDVAEYARNAGRLDGLSADEIVRASSRVNSAHLSNFYSRGFSNLHHSRFVAPGKGVLMVWSGLSAQWDEDSDPGTYAELVARITVDRRSIGAPQRVEISRSTRAGIQPMGLSAAIPVKTGPHRINLQARTARGEALTYLHGRHTEILFVPFGAEGVRGSL